MNISQVIIGKQGHLNQGKNLFCNGTLNSLRFSPETLSAIGKIDLPDANTESLLIDYSANRAIEAFCLINQYYTFDKKSHSILGNLYVELLRNTRQFLASTVSL